MSPVCPTSAGGFCTVSAGAGSGSSMFVAARVSEIEGRSLRVPPFVDGGHEAFDGLIDRRTGADEVGAHVTMYQGDDLLSQIENDTTLGVLEVQVVFIVHA